MVAESSRDRIVRDVRERLAAGTQEGLLPDLATEPLNDELAVRVALSAYARAYFGEGTQNDGRTVDEALHLLARTGGDIFTDCALWSALERMSRFGIGHAGDALTQLADLLHRERIGLDWTLFAVDMAEAMEAPVGSAHVVYRWSSDYYHRLGVPRSEANRALLAVLSLPRHP